MTEFKPGDRIAYTVKTRKITAEVVREVESVSEDRGWVRINLVGGGWMQGHMVRRVE